MTLLQYPGKKNSIADWVIGHFPHDYQSMTYLEPFLGSGCIFLRKERSIIETINDLDNDISNLFLQIRDNPEELMLLLMNTPWSRYEFDLSYEKTDNPVEQARRCLVRFWFTIGANARTKGGMRFDIKENSGATSYFHLKLPEVIAKVSERLKHTKKSIVQIENRNVFDLIPKYNYENVFMYLDPPYLLETRKNKKVYKCEFSDNDHEELLKRIVSSKAKIVISGYESDLYKKYLTGWRIDKIMNNDQKGNRRIECVWMNFSENQNSLFVEENL